MRIEELKKKRNFEVKPSFTDDLYLNFKSSDVNLSREVETLFKELGLECRGVCGGKSVGGYYVSTFISPMRAKEVGII